MKTVKLVRRNDLEAVSQVQESPVTVKGPDIAGVGHGVYPQRCRVVVSPASAHSTGSPNRVPSTGAIFKGLNFFSRVANRACSRPCQRPDFNIAGQRGADRSPTTLSRQLARLR
jgi:hypothetical protein